MTKRPKAPSTFDLRNRKKMKPSKVNYAKSIRKKFPPASHHRNHDYYDPMSIAFGNGVVENGLGDGEV